MPKRKSKLTNKKSKRLIKTNDSNKLNCKNASEQANHIENEVTENTIGKFFNTILMNEDYAA